MMQYIKCYKTQVTSFVKPPNELYIDKRFHMRFISVYMDRNNSHSLFQSEVKEFLSFNLKFMVK